MDFCQGRTWAFGSQETETRALPEVETVRKSAWPGRSVWGAPQSLAKRLTTRIRPPSSMPYFPTR